MWKKYAILSTVCLGTVLSAYVSSCINIALPNIMAALNFDMDSIVWVSLSYLLPYGATLPVTGKLGDLFGAKRVYITGLIMFTVSSLFCGAATSSTIMIIFRVLQGIGAGMLLPNAMAIVAATFAPHERGQALGIWSAMAAAGSAFGPTLGGYLIERIDWRSIFYSFVPVAVLGILAALVLIPSSKPGSKQADIDYAGAITLVASLSALLISLNQGQKEGWLSSLYIVTMLYIALAFFIIFILVELHSSHPMVDLSLFKNANFTVANVVGFLSFAAMYGGMFLLPFFLRNVMDYSSINAGLMMLPLSASMIVFAPVGGRLADRFGSRLPAFAGISLISLALYLFTTISPDYGKSHFFLRLLLLGMGLGFTMSPLTNCAISSLPRDKMGVGSGVFNLFKIIGGSMGVVFVETLLTNRETVHSQILASYLSPAYDQERIFTLLQNLWGRAGMDNTMLATATRGLFTGSGLLPQQYTMLKLLLAQMVQRSATVLAFQDVFFVVALICFAGGLTTLLIKRT